MSTHPLPESPMVEQAGGHLQLTVEELVAQLDEGLIAGRQFLGKWCISREGVLDRLLESPTAGNGHVARSPMQEAVDSGVNGTEVQLPGHVATAPLPLATVLAQVPESIAPGAEEASEAP